jgi:hypothetical protein
MIELSLTFDRLVELASQHFNNHLTPWTVYQAAIIPACLLLA